jgi:hypothetical protein
MSHGGDILVCPVSLPDSFRASRASPIAPNSRPIWFVCGPYRSPMVTATASAAIANTTSTMYTGSKNRNQRS